MARKAGTRPVDAANHTSSGDVSAAGTRGDSATTRRPGSPKEAPPLIERVVERENMTRAYRRVVGNRGAPGIDGMTLDDLKPYLDVHWPAIKRHLLAGTYRPKPTRRVEIPKASGGKRQLGIPTVVDRLIGQALAQVLTPGSTRCRRTGIANGTRTQQLRNRRIRNLRTVVWEAGSGP